MRGSCPLGFPECHRLKCPPRFRRWTRIGMACPKWWKIKKKRTSGVANPSWQSTVARSVLLGRMSRKWRHGRPPARTPACCSNPDPHASTAVPTWPISTVGRARAQRMRVVTNSQQRVWRDTTRVSHAPAGRDRWPPCHILLCLLQSRQATWIWSFLRWLPP